jgi:hypothetical protein
VEYACSQRDLPGSGRLRNISVRGMYVEDPHHELGPGSLVRTSLKLTSQAASLVLEGRVVRTDADGFAVLFQGIGLRIERRLRAILPLTEQLQQSVRA